ALPISELAGPARESSPGRVESYGVVLPRVRGVAHHAVHPVVRRDPRAGEDDPVDRGGAEREVAQERVDRQARVAGVVLQPREPLLRRAADDRAVTQHGRRRAVRFTDPEHDHAATMIAANGERTSTPTRERSEEHTSELQSPDQLVCRLLLEK